MKSLIESLSLGTGAILIAVLSAAAVWILSTAFPVALRKLWAVIVPLVLAYCLYWSPVWLGADRSEYDAWALLGIVAWFLAGVIPAALVVSILGRRDAKKRSS